MNAPDEHWLLVKNLWLPIESALDSLGAVGEDAREKIDSLAGKLGNSLISELHYLRMERNALIHKNKPLVDSDRWKSAAISSQAAIQSQLDQSEGKSDPDVTKPTGSIKDIFWQLLVLAAWGIGSWYLKEFCNFLFTKVNSFSLAWWLIGSVWLLCWPGIIAGGIFGGIIVIVVSAVAWLLKYFFAHPV